jgi:hypothetical protein
LSSASNGEELGVADVGDQRVAPDGLAQLLGDGDAGSVAAGGAGQAEQHEKLSRLTTAMTSYRSSWRLRAPIRVATFS